MVLARGHHTLPNPTASDRLRSRLIILTIHMMPAARLMCVPACSGLKLRRCEYCPGGGEYLCQHRSKKTGKRRRFDNCKECGGEAYKRKRETDKSYDKEVRRPRVAKEKMAARLAARQSTPPALLLPLPPPPPAPMAPSHLLPVPAVSAVLATAATATARALAAPATRPTAPATATPKPATAAVARTAAAAAATTASAAVAAHCENSSLDFGSISSHPSNSRLENQGLESWFLFKPGFRGSIPDARFRGSKIICFEAQNNFYMQSLLLPDLQVSYLQ